MPDSTFFLNRRTRRIELAKLACLAYKATGDSTNQQWRDRTRNILGAEGWQADCQVESGTEWFHCWDEHRQVISIRGTEQTLWEWVRNIDATLAPSPFRQRRCRIHEGFRNEAQVILDHTPLHPRLPLYLTGHSKGAADAIALASMLYRQGRKPAGVLALSPPRVGNAAFADVWSGVFNGSADVFVRCGDLVPRLPPAWLGFRHPSLRYIDRRGDISESPTASFMFFDRLAQRFDDLFSRRVLLNGKSSLLGHHDCSKMLWALTGGL